MANAYLSATGNAGVDYFAVQVGADVLVFVDDGNTDHATGAVVLVGRSLADIDFGNIL
jgi:hypothetical protein